MGCNASKPQVASKPNVSETISRRESYAKSADSGISLSEDELEHNAVLPALVVKSNETFSRTEAIKKGIAFEILADDETKRKCQPPRRFQSILAHSSQEIPETVETSSNKSHMLQQIAEKQLRAKLLREQERLSVVARQRKREAKARKVKERKKKLLEDSDLWQDDNLSDIEVDDNFNTSDDYDFMNHESGEDSDAESKGSDSEDKEVCARESEQDSSQQSLKLL